MAQSDGTVLSWGKNSFGGLAANTPLNVNQATPVQVVGLVACTHLSAGLESNSCFVENGGAKCSGRNNVGQLGTGNQVDTNQPTAVLGLSTGVARITCGYDHACALLDNGGAMCWGNSANGRMANNVAASQAYTSPVRQCCHSSSSSD